VIEAMTAAAAAVTPAGPSEVGTIIAILASAVIVLGGLAALMRSVWRVASVLHDNTAAIERLTKRFDDSAGAIDERLHKLADRVYQLELREFGRHPADEQPGAPDHYPGSHHRPPSSLSKLLPVC